jgi:hypothetical protein
MAGPPLQGADTITVGVTMKEKGQSGEGVKGTVIN